MYKPKPFMHAGMEKKPLVPYNPTSYRNRLPEPTVVMPYKNSNQIIIGDRTNAHKRRYVSNSMNHYAVPSLTDAVSNPGILAERTKWIHKQMLK